MGKESDIQWTDATWNPWQGCRKVSQGCKFCYAERLATRFGKNFSQVFRSTVKTFNSPLKWEDPKKVFTCSISDFFIEEADLWRKEAWDIIRSTPQHTYQILTKRPERINVCLPSDWGDGWDNVWLGVSGESSNMIVKRSRIFETVKAKTKFISIEPLLESVSSRIGNAIDQFQWVIVGGESGSHSHSRTCESEWIHGVVNLCRKKNIPVFVKQIGSKYAVKLQMQDWHGGNIDQFPETLRVREFPVKELVETI